MLAYILQASAKINENNLIKLYKEDVCIMYSSFCIDISKKPPSFLFFLNIDLCWDVEEFANVNPEL